MTKIPGSRICGVIDLVVVILTLVANCTDDACALVILIGIAPSSPRSR